MVVFKSSVFYLRGRIFARLLYLQLIRHFGVWRLLFTLFFLFLYLIHFTLLLFFRILDELFYPAYRNVRVKDPVFIIANPRSGTTYLHRLLCMDEGRFTFMKFAHTLYPAVSFVRFAAFISKVDNRLGQPIRKAINALDKKIYGGWEDIHAMGFNKAEEDEAPFAGMGFSPGLFILFPFGHLLPAVGFLDDELPEVRRQVMDMYVSSVQRFIFATGNNRIYLSKNVMSSGRLKTLQSRFPDARIIYLVRNPAEALPSLASMFTVMYPLHSPGIPHNHPAYRYWIELGSRFYDAFLEMEATLPKKQVIGLRYDELLREPEKIVLKIYDYFGWEVSDDFASALKRENSKAKNYRSAHHYHLNNYGFTEQEILDRNKAIIRRFGF